MSKNKNIDSLEGIILHLLLKNGEMYGYEFTQKIFEFTKNHKQPSPQSIYNALHTMESDGTLSVFVKNIGNRYRKYYSIASKNKPQKAHSFEDLYNQFKSLKTSLFPSINSI